MSRAYYCQLIVLVKHYAPKHMVVHRDGGLFYDKGHNTGKCIRRFAGIYAYCRYFIDRKW